MPIAAGGSSLRDYVQTAMVAVGLFPANWGVYWTEEESCFLPARADGHGRVQDPAIVAVGRSTSNCPSDGTLEELMSGVGNLLLRTKLLGDRDRPLVSADTVFPALSPEPRPNPPLYLAISMIRHYAHKGTVRKNPKMHRPFPLTKPAGRIVSTRRSGGRHDAPQDGGGSLHPDLPGLGWV